MLKFALVLCIGLVVIGFFPYIRDFISYRINARKNYKMFCSVCDAYENLMYSRKLFHSAKEAEIESVRKRIINEAQEIYLSAYEVLENAENQNYIEFVPDEFKDSFLEMLAAKQYKLM